MIHRLKLLILILSAVMIFLSSAHATFSIVAVDTVTGEVGSAGASCINSSRIISDMLIDTGAIHTQALYLSNNQQRARSYMRLGWTPQQIIDSVTRYDFQNSPWVRQYGIVELTHGTSAAFTGDSCTDWKGHRNGSCYSAQGNILLGPEVVDTMVYAFTHSHAPLANRLMDALQAAKRPGADTRCLSAGKSAISSFIRVSRTGDIPGNLYLDIFVPTTTGSTDPIDVLQTEFDAWLDTMRTTGDPFLSTVVIGRDTLRPNGTDTTRVLIIPRNNRGQPLGTDAQLEVFLNGSGFGMLSELTYIGNGAYTAIITASTNDGEDTLSVYSGSGLRQGEFQDHPVIHYYLPSHTTGNQPNGLANTISLSVFPSPFNSVTQISFDLPEYSPVDLQVFDLLGRSVAVLESSSLNAGHYSRIWNATSLSSGLYFISLRVPSAVQVRKVLYVR